MSEIGGVHRLFEIQAANTPEALALVFGNQKLTYGELNRRANFLARRLKEAGAEAEAIVGLHRERSAEMIVGLLAILKAGAAYVPLDPALPAERLAFILADTQTRLILTQPRLLPALSEYSGQSIIAEDGEEEQNGESIAAGDSLMFVIYTSGSTGTPKGVLGTHRGILDLVNWSFHGLPPEEESVYCFTRSLNFIGGLFDIFRPLVNGRPLIILTEEERRDARQLTQLVTRHGVTRLSITPSLFRGMLEAYPDLRQRLRSVKTCILAGEPLSVELCRRAREVLPQIPLLNTYGATEVSGVATVFDARNLSPDAASVPIGKPIRGVSIHILDSEMQPVCDGETGELYIGGAGVARGYLNGPELNAERFLADPFHEAPGMRLFRTGDRARYRSDGEIEFLGRADHQVNLRGFRIELGEIEAALTRHPRVQSAAVTVGDDTSGDQRLIAYTVPITDSALTTAELRRFLRQSLPDYMIPAIIVLLDHLPLNASGKVDRAALLAPENYPSNIGTGYSASTDDPGPHDEDEAALTTLWSQVMGLHSVGVQDNFFDLGGHSLLAIRLLSRIEREFGIHLTLAALLAAPTIAQMAAVLRQARTDGPSWSSLVPLQTQGNRPPLFCAPVNGGIVHHYRNLAAHIGANQPVYTFEPFGMSGLEPPHETVEAMAAYYLQQIRAVQPYGPYYFCGLSFGGLIAFEMARQLQAAGEAVGRLILLDSWAPGYPITRHDAPLDSRRERLYTLRYRGAAHLNNLSLLPAARERARYVSVIVARLGRNILDRTAGRRHPLDGRGASVELPEMYRKVEEAAERARAVYQPDRYDGPVYLLQAHVRNPRYKREPLLGWGALAPQIEVIITPGTHYSLLMEPCIQETVKHLQRLLEDTQGATNS